MLVVKPWEAHLQETYSFTTGKSYVGVQKAVSCG